MRKQILIGLALVSLIFPKIVLAIDEKELAFGYYADGWVVLTSTFLFNESLNTRINEIGNKVAKTSEVPDIKYTFRVVNDPAINAYSGAGGFIYVNTGLLDVLESEDELASVLAHEIAHISKHHQIDFAHAVDRRQRLVSATISGVNVAVGVVGATALAQATTAAATSAGYGAQIAAQLNSTLAQSATSSVLFGAGNAWLRSMISGYGRKLELEADALAIRYMKKAGYNPYALISVFKRYKSTKERLGLNERSYASHLINAEPGLDERIKYLEELISKGE